MTKLSDKEIEPHWTDRFAEYAARGHESGAEHTDEQIAGAVRMLMRDDLSHEAICVMGRDRIARLSRRVAHLEAHISDLKEQNERVREEERAFQAAAKFVAAAMETFGELGQWEGSDLQDALEAAGLTERAKFDPAIHGEPSDQPFDITEGEWFSAFTPAAEYLRAASIRNHKGENGDG